MWQTNIMEGMRQFLEKIDSSENLYTAVVKTVYTWIPRVHTFYFGDIKDLVSAKLNKTDPLFSQYPEYNRLPFPACLFEGHGFGYNKTQHQYAAKKRAIFAIGDYNFVVLLLLHCVDSNSNDISELKDTWILEPFMALIRIGMGEEFKEGSLFDHVLNYSEKISHEIFSLNLGEHLTIPLIKNPLIDPNTWFQDASADMTFLKHALLMLHCKNIAAKKVMPSEKLNKKRQKNNKLPFLSYHILTVEFPSKTKSTFATGKGTKHRLNYCSGHYKHYTTEKPLFGKYAGLFWWDSFARGNPELGRVKTEHRIIKEK